MYFFVDGVATIADEAVDTARDLFTLVAADRERVLAWDSVNMVAVQLFERLPRRPIVSAPWVVEMFATSKPPAGRAIQALEGADVLVETTGKKRDRSYVYQAYLDRLGAVDLAGNCAPKARWRTEPAEYCWSCASAIAHLVPAAQSEDAHSAKLSAAPIPKLDSSAKTLRPQGF